jgi:peptidoglycan/LPS O-acetylase OafA/YrhL
MNESAAHLIERSPGRRILALDSLRGLAAFVVIWHHFHQAFTLSKPPIPLRPFVAGRAAVLLFFVLSGYVLSIPYWNGRQPAYGTYLVKRFFRIYVPYAAAVLVSLLVGMHFMYAQLPLSHWFYETWHEPFTRGLILRQLFTVSTDPDINTAFWSLRYEMEMSLVFPAICWTIGKLRPIPAFLLALGLAKVAAVAALYTSNANLLELCNTVIYGSCFVYGAIMALKRTELAAAYARMPRWLKVVFLVVSATGYFNTTYWLAPMGSCGVILLAQHSRARHWLVTRVPEYLGRISYSMYLMHGVVLFPVLILLLGKVSVPVLAAIFLVTTLAASHLFCVLVEEPAMRLGKRLTSR